MSKQEDLAARAPMKSPPQDEGNDGAEADEGDYSALESALNTVGDHLNTAMKGKQGVGAAKKLHALLSSHLKSLADKYPDAEAANTPGPEADAPAEKPAKTLALEEESMQDGELRELLGIEESADIKQAVIGLKAASVSLSEHESVKAELAQLKSDRDTETAKALVESALATHKLAPRQKDWALALCADNREAFEAYLSSAPMTWTDKEYGSNGQSEPTGAEVNETALKIAKELGVDPEKLMAREPLAKRLERQRQDKEAAWSAKRAS